MTTQEPLIEINNLSVSFPHKGKEKRFFATRGVQMSIFPGQTLAVVGESGSGKSVSAMSVLQLIPAPPARYESGSILWRGGIERGRTDTGTEHKPIDLLKQSDRQMQKVRGNRIAMIFQEPMTSLNPVYTIGEQIIEAVLLHQKVNTTQAIEIAERALRDVGIADPHARINEYPHQLSGGMRQRVMIAMALACQPALLLADEPTTALDVTIQAQILELLRHLQHEKQMAVMLITHDLGVVAENADVVAVMYAGRVLEYATVEELFEKPMHPYTRGLLKSMPILGQKAKRLPTVGDSATIPDDFPSGYRVQPHVVDLNPEMIYGGEHARLHEILPNHWVLCEKTQDSPNDVCSTPQLPYRREIENVSVS